MTRVIALLLGFSAIAGASAALYGPLHASNDWAKYPAL